MNAKQKAKHNKQINNKSTNVIVDTFRVDTEKDVTRIILSDKVSDRLSRYFRKPIYNIVIKNSNDNIENLITFLCSLINKSDYEYDMKSEKLTLINYRETKFYFDF